MVFLRDLMKVYGDLSSGHLLQLAIENLLNMAPFIEYINLLDMVIFHSYVKLQEGHMGKSTISNYPFQWWKEGVVRSHGFPYSPFFVRNGEQFGATSMETHSQMVLYRPD